MTNILNHEKASPLYARARTRTHTHTIDVDKKL